MQTVFYGWEQCEAHNLDLRKQGHTNLLATAQLYNCRGQEQCLLESETDAENDAADNSNISCEGELVDYGDDSVQSDALSVVTDREDGLVADINSKGPRVMWLHIRRHDPLRHHHLQYAT